MLDALYIALGVVFAALLWGFVLGCARLEKKS